MMQYRNLGGTGLRVSAFALGTANFGAHGNPDRNEAIRAIHLAIDAGINFFDSADAYSNGEAEQILGAALQGRREHVVVASKFGSPVGSDPNTRGASRRWIMQSVEASLRRLGTDWIDLYQLHRPMPDSDLAETLEALTDLVRQGKIRYFGASATPAVDIVEAQWIAERRRCGRFVSEQAPYSLLARGIETSVLSTCQRHRIGALVWSPLNGGWLSGAYRVGAPAPRMQRAEKLPMFAHLYDLSLPQNQLKLEAAERFAQLAESAGMSLPHLALAFTLRHPAVTSVLTGPHGVQQLENLLGAAELELSDELMDAIDRIVPPGVTLNQADWGYRPPSLQAAALRRPLPGTVPQRS